MHVTERHLKWFNASEFVREGRNWLPSYNPRLLILLDAFRNMTGKVILSPHPLALGRMTYPKNPNSKHIYHEDLGVRAIDIFPSEVVPLTSLIVTAKDIGFTGIGLYPQWTYNGKQRLGMHLDVRDSGVFTWSWIDGERRNIMDARNYGG